MAVGWLYFRYVHDAEWRLPFRRAEVELSPLDEARAPAGCAAAPRPTA